VWRRDAGVFRKEGIGVRIAIVGFIVLTLFIPSRIDARDDSLSMLVEALSLMRKNVSFDFVLKTKCPDSKGGEMKTVKGKTFIKDEKSYRIETETEDAGCEVSVTSPGECWVMKTKTKIVEPGKNGKSHELWPQSADSEEFEITDRDEAGEKIYELVSKKDGSKSLLHIAGSDKYLSRVEKFNKAGVLESDLTIFNVRQEEVQSNLFIKPPSGENPSPADEKSTSVDKSPKDISPDDTLPESVGEPPAPGM
jgi:hypothetical protein